MSTPQDPEQLRPLTPEQDDAVRRALADAGGPVAMPEDVATRIDASLRELASDRAARTGPRAGISENHPEAPAVVLLDSAALRRRRRVRLLFGAAAAVAAVAVGVNVVSDRQGDDVSASKAADSSAAGGAADAQAERKVAPEQAAPDPTPSVAAKVPSASAFPDTASGLNAAVRRVPTDQPLQQVRADHLSQDLLALQHVVLPDPRNADYTGSALLAPADFVCEPAAFGAGRLVGVQYDGQPAVVAFRVPVGATQAADVLACGTGDLIHSTTIAVAG